MFLYKIENLKLNNVSLGILRKNNFKTIHDIINIKTLKNININKIKKKIKIFKQKKNKSFFACENCNFVSRKLIPIKGLIGKDKCPKCNSNKWYIQLNRESFIKVING